MSKKYLDDVKTGVLSATLGQIQGKPDYCLNGIRHTVDVNRIQAFVWNVGTHHPMLREKLKCQKHKSESTEADGGGGTVCSSEEVFVMKMEQRDCRF